MSGSNGVFASALFLVGVLCLCTNILQLWTHAEYQSGRRRIVCVRRNLGLRQCVDDGHALDALLLHPDRRAKLVRVGNGEGGASRSELRVRLCELWLRVVRGAVCVVCAACEWGREVRANVSVPSDEGIRSAGNRSCWRQASSPSSPSPPSV